MVACGQGQGSCQEWGWSWKTNCGQESPDLEGGVLFYKRGGGGGALAEYFFSKGIPTLSNLDFSVCSSFDCL